MNDKQVAYLCDRKKCYSKDCREVKKVDDCQHTCDIRHAINFELFGGDCWIEKTIEQNLDDQKGNNEI